jgi:hypothetical protein
MTRRPARRTRFNVIVSIFPGMRRTPRLLGTDVTAAGRR